jgi:c-di-GMP-binding flagellar brake protein YcgR
MKKKNRLINKEIISSLPITERRHFIRHPLCFPLSYKVSEDDKSDHPVRRSTSINLSMGGILFSTKHRVDKGAKIIVKMPFQDKVFNVRGKVVRCVKKKKSDLYNVGVCFYKLSDAHKAKLIEQLYLISEYRDLRTIETGKEISFEKASREWIKRYSKRFKRMYW